MGVSRSESESDTPYYCTLSVDGRLGTSWSFVHLNKFEMAVKNDDL